MAIMRQFTLDFCISNHMLADWSAKVLCLRARTIDAARGLDRWATAWLACKCPNGMELFIFLRGF